MTTETKSLLEEDWAEWKRRYLEGLLWADSWINADELLEERRDGRNS